MAEAESGTSNEIAAEDKVVLKQSTSKESSPVEDSKPGTNQKGRRRSKKPKKEQALESDGIPTTNKSGDSNSSIMSLAGKLSVSVDRNGHRTSHNQQGTTQSLLPQEEINPLLQLQQDQNPSSQLQQNKNPSSQREKILSTQPQKGKKASSQQEKHPSTQSQQGKNPSLQSQQDKYPPGSGQKKNPNGNKKENNNNKSRNNSVDDRPASSKLKAEPIVGDRPYQQKARVSPEKQSKDTSKSMDKKSSSLNKGSNVKAGQNKSISEEEKQFKEKLENNWIFPLRKKSTKFPRANYFCRVCSYHLDHPEDCKRHMGEKRHQRRKEVTESENILRFIPNPTEKQLESLNVLLTSVCEEQVLTPAEVETRKSVMESLELFIKITIPDIELKMYGSSSSGFGLKTSNVNIYVYSASSKCMPKVLVSIYELFKQSGDKFKNVESDFYSKVPAVLYEDPATGIKCQLTINSCFARDTSRLLNVYSSLDARAVQLGVVFRTWAKICGLDRQKEGTLPAYSLSLMTVYYLQNTTPPVLPTFHKNFPKFSECEEKKEEWFSSISIEAGSWKTENTQSLSELWLGMLRFYVLNFDTANDVVSIKIEKLSRTEKKWNSKKLAIEDPFAPKLNVARTVSNAMIYEYLQDTLRKAYHYFGLPRNEIGDSWIPIDILDKIAGANALKEYKQKETNAENFNHETSPESNNLNSMNTSEATVDMTDIDLNMVELSLSDPVASDGLNSTNNSQHDKDGDSDGSLSVSSTTAENGMSNYKLFAQDFAKKIINRAIVECQTGSKNNCSSDTKPSEKSSSSANPAETVLDLASFMDMDSLLDRECFYNFTEEVLSDGKGLPVICGFCEGEGHLRNNCPEDVLPNLRPLPRMTNKHLQVLSETLQNVIYDFAPRPEDIQKRKWILKDVEIFIQKFLYHDACLQLFGSSCNGFGFSKSDLDICLTFKDKTSEGLDYVQVIKNLASQLEKHSDLRGITAITTAKVPIVKFRHKQTGLEGDISLYNTLAQHNTTLLETYSCMDDRVSILGYALKVFAKVCEIGDASKGSLSSYAYVLMLLHYLQQCEPPVIPVLQELHTGEKPELFIEGWNVWFYRDLKTIPNVWPGYRKNTQSIGELWLGLFKYYSEFPVKDNVITIRQKGPLTRFEKLWNGECLSIEDPFDLNHNLGGGLSKKMNNYILHALIHARELYGTPFEGIPQLTTKYPTPADYFFDPFLLTEGRPPNDRGCRECGKIGHIAKKCPQHLKNMQRKKEREARQREEKQRAAQNHGGETGREEYGDRNGMRHTPNREPRRRNNSYNEYQRDRAPLLPTPVMRTRNDSHPGSRGSPQPLMDVVVDNNGKRQSTSYPIHQVFNQGQDLQQEQANSNITEKRGPHDAGTFVTTTSGSRVFLPSNMPQQQQHYKPPAPQANLQYMVPQPSFPNMAYGYQPTGTMQQQAQPQPLQSNQPMSHPGPNGSQKFNVRNNAPIPRHKNYYVQQ